MTAWPAGAHQWPLSHVNCTQIEVLILAVARSRSGQDKGHAANAGRGILPPKIVLHFTLRKASYLYTFGKCLSRLRPKTLDGRNATTVEDCCPVALAKDS